MTKILINRGHKGNNQILGLLQIIKNNKVLFGCHTLELPDKGNARNVSCVPTGEYSAKKHTRPSGQKAIWIMDVPNRSAILIHLGNFNSDIQGCILVGKYLKDIDNDNYLDVGASTITMTKILKHLPNEFKVEIR